MLHRFLVSWVVFLWAAGAGPAMAQDILKRIADRQQVVIGYSETAAPFSFRAGGAPAGYAIELCGSVVDRLRRELGQPGLAARFVPVDQDSVVRHVSAGSVDLLCGGVSDTPARRNLLTFSAPIFLSAVKLMVRADDGPRTLSALKGKTVAVVGRTTAEAAINTLNKQQGLDIRMSRVVSPDAALSELRLHQADAWARDEILLLGTIAREPDAARFAILQDVLSTETIAIAMPPDAQMQRFVNATLAELTRSGRLEPLYDKWFVHPNPAAASGLKAPMSPELKAEFARLR